MSASLLENDVIYISTDYAVSDVEFRIRTDSLTAPMDTASAAARAGSWLTI